MLEAKENFLERMLGAESLSQAYQKKYEEAIKNMLEKKLSAARRFATVLAAIICLGVAVLVGIKAVSATQTLVQIGLLIGFVLNLACAVLMGTIAIRGTANLKNHPMLVARFTWVAAFALMLVAIALGLTLSDPITSIQVVLFGLVALVMAGIFIMLKRIDHTAIETQEKLLEIQYRLSEIAERMEK